MDNNIILVSGLIFLGSWNLKDNPDMVYVIKHNLTISYVTVAKILDGHLYTTKKLINQPANWNSDLTKVARQDYFNWIFGASVNSHLVYVDEAGYNLWTSRTYGRAPIGEPAVRIVDGLITKRSFIEKELFPCWGFC